jgi:hypothetical protein
MTPYLWLLLALVALAYYWRTVAVLSVVAIAASVTPHMKVAKR